MGGWWWWWKPNLLYDSGPNLWVLSSLSWTLPNLGLPDPHLTLTWPGPGPELDKNLRTRTWTWATYTINLVFTTHPPHKPKYGRSRLGLQGGHQVGLQGGHQGALQGVQSFKMDSRKVSMSQEWSGLVSGKVLSTWHFRLNFRTNPYLTSQKLKVI